MNITTNKKDKIPDEVYIYYYQLLIIRIQTPNIGIPPWDIAAIKSTLTQNKIDIKNQDIYFTNNTQIPLIDFFHTTKASKIELEWLFKDSRAINYAWIKLQNQVFKNDINNNPETYITSGLSLLPESPPKKAYCIMAFLNTHTDTLGETNNKINTSKETMLNIKQSYFDVISKHKRLKILDTANEETCDWAINYIYSSNFETYTFPGALIKQSAFPEYVHFLQPSVDDKRGFIQAMVDNISSISTLEIKKWREDFYAAYSQRKSRLSEKGKKKRINIPLGISQHQKLVELTKIQRRSQAEVIEHLIEAEYQKEKSST
tara:strand:+ start:43198 stop:44148 length:951 start_codon:yes stop_codon:yes gene_type:complete